MRIFGQKRDLIWEEENNYLCIRHFPSKIQILITDLIHYQCQLCDQDFDHWLCDDKIWLKLPKVIRQKKICLIS